MPSSPEAWTWHGFPGHYISADRCRFRLHTTVGRYRVSSVGAFFQHPNDEEPTAIGGAGTGPPGSGRLYETMVFALGANGEPDDWMEIDGDAYMEPAAAEAGHMAMCEKWAAR